MSETIYIMYTPNGEPEFEIVDYRDNTQAQIASSSRGEGVRIIKVENYEKGKVGNPRLTIMPIDVSGSDISENDGLGIVVDASSNIVDASSNIVSQYETITEQTITPELTENPPIQSGKGRTRTNRRKALEKKKTKKRKSKE